MHTQPITRARELRSSMTRAEVTLWQLIRNRQLAGLKFRRQHPIGPYFLDFFNSEHSVAIELDGESHEGRLAHDEARDKYLLQRGITVLRFSNSDFEKNTVGVRIMILRACGLGEDC